MLNINQILFIFSFFVIYLTIVTSNNQNSYELDILRNYIFMVKIGYWMKISESFEKQYCYLVDYQYICKHVLDLPPDTILNSGYNYSEYIIDYINNVPDILNTNIESNSFIRNPTENIKYIRYHNTINDNIIEYIYFSDGILNTNYRKIHNNIILNVQLNSFEAIYTILDNKSI